jgi:hypothetical protein
VEDKNPPLVHLKLVNTFLPKLCTHAALLPPNQAILTINQLGKSGLHQEARIMLAQIQDKWFEAWKEPAVAKSTKRPKKKLDISGIYCADSRNKNPGRCVFVESLTDEALKEAIEILHCDGISSHDPQSVDP